MLPTKRQFIIYFLLVQKPEGTVQCCWGALSRSPSPPHAGGTEQHPMNTPPPHLSLALSRLHPSFECMLTCAILVTTPHNEGQALMEASSTISNHNHITYGVDGLAPIYVDGIMVKTKKPIPIVCGTTRYSCNNRAWLVLDITRVHACTRADADADATIDTQAQTLDRLTTHRHRYALCKTHTSVFLQRNASFLFFFPWLLAYHFMLTCASDDDVTVLKVQSRMKCKLRSVLPSAKRARPHQRAEVTASKQSLNCKTTVLHVAYKMGSSSKG